MKKLLLILIMISTPVYAETIVEPYQPFKKKNIQTVVDKFEENGNTCYVVNTLSYLDVAVVSVSISCVANQTITKKVVDTK